MKTLKLTMLLFGLMLQLIALYIAFFEEFYGNIYLATLLVVLSLVGLLLFKGLVAPVCLLAGVVIGLSLSHNQADRQILTHLQGDFFLTVHLIVNGKFQPVPVPADTDSPFRPEIVPEPLPLSPDAIPVVQNIDLAFEGIAFEGTDFKNNVP